MRWLFFLAVLLITSFGAFAKNPGEYVKGLPSYSKKDVALHKSPKKRIWVTYGQGVYDITDFVKDHPGGGLIKNSFGGSVEQYWKMYRVHRKKEVHDILESHRIGNLSEKLSVVEKDQDKNPFTNDPQRDPRLVVKTKTPFNAETPVESLTTDFITPNSCFYVRNHLPVPKVNPTTYKLTITSEGGKIVELSLNDLKTKFKPHTITATIQCAGNRRTTMSSYKPVHGTAWGTGAIGTAQWTGVKLKDVLKHAQINFKVARFKHVQFEGLDRNSDTAYGASIPIEKAIDIHGDVVLAYEMNGEDLPPDHGYPLRVVVPGVVGARSVKWLAKITVSPYESQKFWQQQDYKLIPENTDLSAEGYTKFPAIQEMPVQSVILSPENNSTIKQAGKLLTVKGYAWSGGGRAIHKVDVTIDGGKTWVSATLKPGVKQPRKQAWAWTPWEATFKPLRKSSSLDIYSNATDTSGNRQPKDLSKTWNVRGLLCNTWSHCRVALGG